MNRLRERITSIHMTDQGCMLRGYDREIVDAILDSEEANTFIPALAYLYSGNPVEVVVEHEERAAGESKYPLFKLIHLNFDLMTGFSLMPLQLFSLIGLGISIASVRDLPGDTPTGGGAGGGRGIHPVCHRLFSDRYPVVRYRPAR